MSLFLDLICAVLLILFVFIGYYRGFAKFAVLLIASFISATLAFLLADVTAGNVYEKYVQKKMTKGLESAIAVVDVTKEVNDRLSDMGLSIRVTADEIKSAFNKTTAPLESIQTLLQAHGLDPESAHDAAGDVFKQVKETVQEKAGTSFDSSAMNKLASKAVSAFDEKASVIFYALSRDDNAYAAEILEKELIRKPFITLLKIVMFLIFYIVFELGFRLIIFLAGLIPGNKISAGMRTGGACLGAVKGAAYCMILAYYAASLVAMMGETNSLLSLNDCHDTLIFRLFFDVFY